MQAPSIPKNENERLNELYDSGLLDTPKESDFDNLTNLASSIFDSPVSIITLIDENRQWFKSCLGLPEEITETPREISFCGHAINNPSEVLVIPDARLDNVFSDNPLVTGDPKIVFYAGAPLISKSGYPLGTLCIIDFKPRKLSQQDVETLKILSNQVSKLIDLRLSNEELTKSLNEKNLLLKEIHHRVKNNLQLVSSLLNLQFKNIENKYVNDAVDKSKDRINSMALIHTKLYQSSNLASIDFGVYLTDLTDSITNSYSLNDNVKCIVTCAPSIFDIDLCINLGLIINELLTNAYKHAFKGQESGLIKVTLTCNADEVYQLIVEDNGVGISKSVNVDDQQSLGLEIVSALTNQIEGTIKTTSNKGVKYTIIFEK